MSSAETSRADVVRARRLAGVPECYNWQLNRKGPYDAERVLSLARGELLSLRELCALPVLLPKLLPHQVELWLSERVAVDLELDPNDLRFPRGRRPSARPDVKRKARGPNRTTPYLDSIAARERTGSLDLAPLTELYADYTAWCFGDGTAATYQEAAPRGAWARVLRRLLGRDRVRQVRHEVETPEGLEQRLETVALGVRLREENTLSPIY